MIFEDTWHWFLAVILFVEVFFWLSKKIVRSMRDLAAAWAEIQRKELRKVERRKRWLNDQAAAARGVIQLETSAKLPARPFIEQSKAEPIKKKDPVFRPGIWMQK